MTRIRVAFDSTLVAVLASLQIESRPVQDNGSRPELEILLDHTADERILVLWDQLTELRIRYIEANQWHQLSLL